jgi:hypothetical protein
VVIANMTLRPDGAWRGLDPVEIYRSQSFATAVYRSELAREAQSLGFAIEVTGADGRWELQGYTREQVMAFSRRRQDIEHALARRGLSGAAAAQNIAHQSRLSKDRRGEDELRAEWRVRAREYGINFQRQHLAVEPASRVEVENAVRFALAHTTEREAVIDRRALEAAALQHAMGRADLNEIRDENRRSLQRGQLLPVSTSQPAAQTSFTTPEMIALERDNLDLMRVGQGRATPIARPTEIQQWAAERGLLSDQVEAAQITLTARDWLTAIEGRAGSAKTTTVGAIAEFAREHGYSVQGFAPTTRAVKSLSEAGVNARTVASLVQNPSAPAAGEKEFWIVDESSLLSTRQMNGLLHGARHRGIERIVFLGDQRQHHAIEAGRPVYQMQQAGMAVARLEVIRRQRDPNLRQAVTFAAEGRIADALMLLENHNRVREIAVAGDRYKAIAREYLAAHEAAERVLVVSPANDERRQLNSAIRDLLRSRGHIAAEGREQIVFVSRNFTKAQRTHFRNYEVGDVVLYRRGSKKLGLARGEYASVEAIEPKNHRIRVRTNGRTIQYNPKRPYGVEVFRPEQRVFAVGDRIQFRAPDRALKAANGELATVVAIDAAKAVLRTDAGREVNAALQRLRHIDYGYASTSHSSQGATVDRIVVNIDTLRSAELVNRKQFYVSISRARDGVKIYTDDREALRHAVNRNREKSVALDQARIRIQPQIKQGAEVQRRTISHHHGIHR